MRGRLLVAAALLGCTVIGCASGVRVTVDETADLAAYRTWNWLRPGPLGRVDAPNSDGPLLDRWVSRLLEKALNERGYAPADTLPDLRVDYELSLRTRRAVVTVPFAPMFLASHHASPSYWVEGSNSESRIYHDIVLWIGLVEPSGATVWEARLSRSVEGGGSLPLADAVSELVGRLPAPIAADARIPSPL